MKRSSKFFGGERAKARRSVTALLKTRSAGKQADRHMTSVAGEHEEIAGLCRDLEDAREQQKATIRSPASDQPVGISTGSNSTKRCGNCGAPLPRGWRCDLPIGSRRLSLCSRI